MDYNRLEYQLRNQVPKSYKEPIMSSDLRPSQNLSVLQEKNIKYETTTHYLNINSADRDIGNYPLHYDYKINFDTNYKNVCSIELISAVLPNSLNILIEPYLTLDIDGINVIDFANTSISHRGFTTLALKSPTNSNGFIVPDLGPIFHTMYHPKTPLASLNSFSIKWRNVSGALYTFNEPSGSILKKDQHSLLFRIVCKEVSRENLNHRNVF
jgi:hypothetical protein